MILTRFKPPSSPSTPFPIPPRTPVLYRRAESSPAAAGSRIASQTKDELARATHRSRSMRQRVTSSSSYPSPFPIPRRFPLPSFPLASSQHQRMNDPPPPRTPLRPGCCHPSTPSPPPKAPRQRSYLLLSPVICIPSSEG